MSFLEDLGGAVFGGNSIVGSTAGALAGPLLNYHGQEQSIDAQMQQVARNEALQREFAQHGVRWRVEDAKAAGVHPLFALGGSGASYSPNAIVVGHENEALGRAVSDMGQNISRAVQAQETAEQRLQRQLAMEAQLAGIEKDYAQASYWWAQSAKAKQESVQTGPAMPGLAVKDVGPQYLDRVTPKAADQISARSEDMSVEAPLNPLMQERTITPYGLRMRLPKSDEPMESWGELSWYDKMGLIAHNMAYYGEDSWGGRFLREFLRGKAPLWRSTDPRLGGSSMEPESYRGRGRSTGGYRRGR